MRYDWLQEMVSEGLVSEAAANTIMDDCRGMAKEAMQPDKTNLDHAIGGLMFGLSVVGGQRIANKMTDIFGKMQDIGAMKKVKMELHADPMLGTDKAKTDARLRELIQHAPAIAVDAEKAKRIIKKHYNGFSDEDIQNLQSLQMMMGSQMPYSDTSKYEESIKEKMMKSASAGQQISPETLGSTLADVYVLQETMTKEANFLTRGFGTVVNKFKETKNPMLQFMAANALLSGAGLAISAGAGAVSHVKDKMDQKKFKDQLEQSFSQALRDADPDSSIRQKPEAARKAFQTLVHFSPNVAAEPRAARSFMTKLVDYESQGVEPSDIKDLVEIERNFKQTANKPNPFFSAFSTTGKLIGLDKSISQGMSTATKPYTEAYEEGMKQEMGLPNAFDKELRDQQLHIAKMNQMSGDE